MVIDAHSHIFLPRYVEMLKKRKSIPRIIFEDGSPRFLYLPKEDESTGSMGRPIDSSYWDMEQKIGFMKANGIELAVLSPSNPWLDFLGPDEAGSVAHQLNEDLEEICSGHPGCFCGLAVIPLQNVSASLSELDHIVNLTYVKGAVIGTKGTGKGLDDPALDRVWERAEQLRLPLYIHPHYGISEESFGELPYRLDFALGFPFETTIAVTRLVLSGVLERFPTLNLILAHGGGTLPYLAGRLDTYSQNLRQRASDYLRRLYHDAILFHEPAIHCALAFAGSDHLLFGTDHPFKKDSSEVYGPLAGLNSGARESILGKNARALFKL